MKQRLNAQTRCAMIISKGVELANGGKLVTVTPELIAQRIGMSNTGVRYHLGTHNDLMRAIAQAREAKPHVRQEAKRLGLI